MKQSLIKLSMSETRSKLTRLHNLLEPGQILQITKRGKPYANIELVGDTDHFDSVLKSIDALPEPEEKTQSVAENYKSLLYGNNDENIHIVISQNNIETIKENDAAGKTTDLSDVSVVATTTGTELEESLDVLDRTKGFTEESSVVTPEGEVTRGETGTGSANADLPFVEGNDNTSIHSHPLETTAKSGYRADQVGPDDPDTFKNYKRNIIVGKFGAPETDVFGKDVPRKKGAAFYKRNVTTKQITNVTMTRKAIKKTLRKVKRK